MNPAWQLTEEELDAAAAAISDAKVADLPAVETCDRCGVSSWHPEASRCTEIDCPITRPAQ